CFPSRRALWSRRGVTFFGSPCAATVPEGCDPRRASRRSLRRNVLRRTSGRVALQRVPRSAAIGGGDQRGVARAIDNSAMQPQNGAPIGGITPKSSPKGISRPAAFECASRERALGKCRHVRTQSARGFCFANSRVPKFVACDAEPSPSNAVLFICDF